VTTAEKTKDFELDVSKYSRSENNAVGKTNKIEVNLHFYENSGFGIVSAHIWILWKCVCKVWNGFLSFCMKIGSGSWLLWTRQWTKMIVFCDIAPCSMVDVYRRFRGIFRLHRQALIMEVASTS
jgi:hypothetical protein